MKKTLSLVFLSVLLISLVSFVYATNENTVASITGSAVNENAGNNGSGCAKEGEKFSKVYNDEYLEKCCSGLTEWNSGMDTRISIEDKCYETRLMSGNPIGICLNCGNNICEIKETPCNCPSDCIGKEKSDYLTKKSFCDSTYYSILVCNDSINEDLDICRLCSNISDENNNLSVVCPQDMKECSNGFLVGRNPNNNCEFNECPGNDNNNSNKTHCAANNQMCGGIAGIACCGNMECYYGENEGMPDASGVCIANPNQIWNRFRNENGDEFEIGENGTGKKIRIKNITSHTDGLNITPEQDRERNQTKLKIKLSNGRNAEIKIMPDVASQVALERLRLKCETRNCSIELKEVGNNKVAYELITEKQAKILALIQSKMQVKAQVDAETGELIRVKKPWWAFLATEESETA
jgi:hypothetical protein